MSYESIHNYYEQLVIDRIRETLAGDATADPEFLEDVACVALNQLPARYVRHQVDLAFYMPPDEREQIGRAVADAVAYAAEYVNRHRDGARPRTITVAGNTAE